MKGVLMKVGQLVSFIAEGLPDEAQQALAALQADAAPMAPTLAAEVVEAELGATPEQIFRRWDDLPVAAASIGQVHRAETTDRREVAVKVQFPGVARGDRGGPRRRRGDVQRVLGAGPQRPRRPRPRRRAAGPDARGARLPPRGAQRRRVRRPLRRPPVGAHPGSSCPSCRTSGC